MQYVVKGKMYCEVNDVAKFKVPIVPATTQKSIRFPNNIIDEVEEAIRGTGASFSAFVIEAARVALENLREDAEAGEDAQP